MDNRSVVVVEADLERPEHQTAILELTAASAADPMGGGVALSPGVRDRVIAGLSATPNARVLLAYLDTEAVGLATCFLGFSTFHARPLINIHDLAVLESTRGHGVGRALLAEVEGEARAMGCCRVTLEVNEGNPKVMQLYHSAGFGQAGADGPTGGALFFANPLA